MGSAGMNFYFQNVGPSSPQRIFI